jgi:hypothetical protein
MKKKNGHFVYHGGDGRDSALAGTEDTQARRTEYFIFYRILNFKNSYIIYNLILSLARPHRRQTIV